MPSITDRFRGLASDKLRNLGPELKNKVAKELKRLPTRIRAAQQENARLTDSYGDPNARLSISQRVRGAIYSTVEQNTLGRSGALGRAIMWKRRGDRIAFRREFLNIINRHTLQRMGPIGDAVSSHLAKTFGTYDDNPDIMEHINDLRPSRNKDPVEVTQVVEVLEKTAKNLDDRFEAIRKGFDDVTEGYRMVDKRLTLLERERNNVLRHMSASVQTQFERVDRLMNNSTDTAMQQMQTIGSQVSEHESKFTNLEAQVANLKKSLSERPTASAVRPEPVVIVADEKKEDDDSAIKKITTALGIKGGMNLLAKHPMVRNAIALTAGAGTLGALLYSMMNKKDPTIGPDISAGKRPSMSLSGGMGPPGMGFQNLEETVKKQIKTPTPVPENTLPAIDVIQGGSRGSGRPTSGQLIRSGGSTPTKVLGSQGQSLMGQNQSLWQPGPAQSLWNKNQVFTSSAPSQSVAPVGGQSISPVQFQGGSITAPPAGMSTSPVGGQAVQAASGQAVQMVGGQSTSGQSISGDWNFTYNKRGVIKEKAKLKARYMELAEETGLTKLSPADAKKYGVDGSAESWANFMMDLTKAESSFRPHTHGDRGQFDGGSRGLFQLSRNDARNYGFKKGKDTIEQLEDPEYNARLAFKIAENRIRNHGRIGGSGMGKYWGPIKRNELSIGNFNNLDAGPYMGDPNMLPPIDVVTGSGDGLMGGTPREPSFNAANLIGGATMFAPGISMSPQQIASSPGGFDRVIEKQGKVAAKRTKPLKSELREYLQYSAEKTGVHFEVTSGGQHKHGPRTGSHRHDTDNPGTIGAADGKLYVMENNKRRYLSVNNPNDRPLIENFTRTFSAVAPSAGVGANYMGSGKSRGELIHFGGGNFKGDHPIAYEGPDWFRQAHATGLKTSKEELKNLETWRFARANPVPPESQITKKFLPTPEGIVGNTQSVNIAGPQGGIISKQVATPVEPQAPAFSAAVAGLAEQTQIAQAVQPAPKFPAEALSPAEQPVANPTESPTMMDQSKEQLNTAPGGEGGGDDQQISDEDMQIASPRFNPETMDPSAGDSGYGEAKKCLI